VLGCVIWQITTSASIIFFILAENEIGLPEYSTNRDPLEKQLRHRFKTRTNGSSPRLLAKYTFIASPLSTHHKIGKKKLGLLESVVFQPPRTSIITLIQDVINKYK
jgi:hypothetical protein